MAEPVQLDFSKFRGAQRMSNVHRLHSILDKCVSARDESLTDEQLVDVVVERYKRSLLPQEGLPPMQEGLPPMQEGLPPMQEQGVA